VRSQFACGHKHTGIPLYVTLRNVPDTVSKAIVGTPAQWRAAGVTAAQLRSLTRHGDLVQVRRGVYATRKAVTAAADDPRRAIALQVSAIRASVGRQVVGSHGSAALIHGFGLLNQPSRELVTLTCPRQRRSRSRTTAGVLFHAAELPQTHVTRAYGTRVTTPARTVIDLARTLPFMEAVVVADSALHTGTTTRAELAGVCDACARWPGITRARDAVAFSNGLAESVLESCARVIFDSFGLEPPEIQVIIRGPGYTFRTDFLWEKSRTVVEADGLSKYTSQEDLRAQFRRDRLLRDAGYQVVHFTWRELFEAPATVIARIRGALDHPTPY
jgi:hypothetical protein